MKPFRIYFKGWSPKQQLVWLGALLIILSLVMTSIGFLSVLDLKKLPTLGELEMVQMDFYWRWVYFGLSCLALGVILILAGAFASEAH